MHTVAIESTHNRATKAQQRHRVMSVYRMLERSESRAAILEYTTSAWRISTRQTDTYIAAACAMHKAQADADAAYHLALALERLNKLFCTAFEARDYRTAIQAQHEMNKLVGLYAT